MQVFTTSFNVVSLNEHVALDRSSWSLKSVCNRLLQNAYDKKDILKVEKNDPHKYYPKTSF